MGISYRSHDLILVNLPGKLREHDAVQRVLEIVHERRNCNAVVDFSRVGVVACATLTRLPRLRQLLQDQECKLVHCSVAPATRGVFTIVRLGQVFDSVADTLAVLAHLRPWDKGDRHDPQFLYAAVQLL